MTNYEFKLEYDKLVECYPMVFGNQHKEKAIFEYIKDLDAKWWKALSRRILLSSNPRIDIEDAARGERIARKRIEETRILLDVTEKFKDITENGLDDALKKIGANSLLEAIEKTKKPGGQDAM